MTQANVVCGYAQHVTATCMYTILLHTRPMQHALCILTCHTQCYPTPPFQSSEHHGVQHGAHGLNDVRGHELGDIVCQVLLGVHLAHVCHHTLLRGQLLLLNHSLVIAVSQALELLDHLLVALVVLLEVLQHQARRPRLLAQVEQHALLQLVLPVVDGDGVVVAVEAVDERLDGGLVEVAQVGGGLARLLAEHHGLGADQAERVNHHLALHTLHRVHHHCHCSLVELLE
mmetsp:Transcript_13927/g.34321  ORF Transcript_13927/g.34321 Transcript_13927/m.34321 type:complete len:229 (+) Transcript_13927:118-804(+)